MFRQVERVGIEAGHLERLIERVVNRVPDLMVNEIIVDEILAFLHDVVEVRRQVVRWAENKTKTTGNGSRIEPTRAGLGAAGGAKSAFRGSSL